MSKFADLEREHDRLVDVFSEADSDLEMCKSSYAARLKHYEDKKLSAWNKLKSHEKLMVEYDWSQEEMEDETP